MKRFWPYLAVILAMLIWSASGIAIKIALEVFTPMSLVVCRFLLAVMLMLLVGLAARGSDMLRLQPLAKRDIPLFVLAGIAQPFLYYVLETYAYQLLSSPTVAEALLSTSPLLSPLFAFVILRERVTVNNIIGILLSSLGVLMLIFVGKSSFELGNPMGVLLAFAAVSAAVLYTIFLRRIPQSYNSLSIVFYVQAISLVFFIPTWLLMDHPSLSAAALSSAISTLTWQASAAVLYLAALSSVTAFILFCFTVRKIGVTQTNAFNNARPIFTALIMMIGFGEQLPFFKWIGIFLIIFGLFICQKQGKTC